MPGPVSCRSATKVLLWILLVFSNFCFAEYFEVAKEASSEELTKCIRVTKGSVEDAIRKVKSEFKSCKDRETIVIGTFSVLCKHPENKPPSYIRFFSKSEKSCQALIEFQKTQRIPEGFRRKRSP